MKQLSLTEARAKLNTLVAEVDKEKAPLRSPKDPTLDCRSHHRARRNSLFD
jgi:hypothetical protein